MREENRSDYSLIEAALKKMLEAMSELRELNVLTNKKDFTCQLGEWLISILFDGERSTNGIQKDWDIKIGDSHVQVKTHSKAGKTPAQWSAISKNVNAQINELIIVVFTEDYKLKSFYKVPWAIALERIVKHAHRDVINWSSISDYKIDIDALPKQDLVKLFK